MNENASEELLWYPLKSFGFTHPFFTLNAETLINTWVALGTLCLTVIILRYFLRPTPSEESTIVPLTFTVHRYGSYISKSIIKSFMNLVEQSIGSFVYRYFAFIGSLFMYILLCNWVGLLPFVGEPTKDLNTTAALGIIALAYIQKEIIYVHGIVQYLKEYFLPVSTFFPLNIIIGLAILPIKILGELSTVISLSFRLFGNIFGGVIILEIFHKGISNSIILNLLATGPINLILIGFFIVFEGALQAFVFAILTLTNIGMALSREEGTH